MEKATNGKYICQYNPECECETQKCYKCGWNPEVADRRLKEFRKAQGLGTKRYKIPFTGHCEVWANSAEEAAEKAEDIQQQFFAHYNYYEPICLEKEEENELD